MKNVRWSLVVHAGIIIFIWFFMTACEKNDRSFSILQAEQEFKSLASYQPRKIDILWVIDNSGSMYTSQENLTSNFSSFINRFKDLNYDFHMSVTTTDAWKGKYTTVYNPITRTTETIDKPKYLRWKIGELAPLSNIFVMDRVTPDPVNVFLKNAMVGDSGAGDERAFESFEAALNYADNSDFRRPEAFFAIIIISDEDDFSATTSTSINRNYTSPNLVPVSHFTDYLNGLAGVDNYSVNAIAIFDEACKTELGSGRIIGTRYGQLADASKGLKVNLCGDFASKLQLISDSILQAVSVIHLEREPIIETLQVTNNGRVVPKDSINGWTFDEVKNDLTFHGSEIPADGQSVLITFDPKEQVF